MPYWGIQANAERSCIPAPGSKAHQSPRATSDSSRVTPSAIWRAKRSGRRATRSAPTSGRRTRAWSAHSGYAMEARKSVIGGSARHDVDDVQGPGEEEHQVEPHLPRLQPAPDAAQPLRQAADAVDAEPVDDPFVHLLPERGLAEPEERADDQGVVDLVDVVLPEEDLGEPGIHHRLLRGNEHRLRGQLPP